MSPVTDPPGRPRPRPTDESVLATVATGGRLVLYMSADWCPACRALAPEMDRVVEELGDRVPFYRVDVDTAPVATWRLGVRSIPAILLVRDGEVVGRLGPSGARAILAAVASLLG